MSDHTKDWPSLAVALYDRLTQRNAEITYEAENVEVWVPSGVGDDTEHAHWKINGTMKIRARDGDTA